MGSYAIIGAHLCIANGAAWSAQIRGSGQVAVAFFGDGTTNIGAFHEALNFAAVWKLPTVFVCENNLYMEYTPIDLVTAVPHPAADRAAVVRAGADPGRRQRRRRRPRHRPTCPGQRPRGRRTGAGRGGHLPARRPQPGRPRQVPAGRRGGGVERRTIRSRSTTGGCCGSGSPEDRLTEDRAPGRRRGRRRHRVRQGGARARPGGGIHRRVGRRRQRMAQLSYREAVAYGIAQEMRRDPSLVMLGEDIGPAGGVFKTTVGLIDEFGPRTGPRHPDLRAGDPGGGDGSGDDRHPGDRRDHVLRLPRRLLGPRSPTRSPRPGT